MSQQRGNSSTPYYTPSAQKTQSAAPTMTVSSSAPAVSASKPPLAPSQQQSRSLRLLGKVVQYTRQTLRGQFTVLASVAMVLAIIMAWFLSQSFTRASNDLNTIAYGSIPSVDAAQTLAQYIDDIDAKSADFMGTAGLTTTSSCSVPDNTGNTTVVGQYTVSQCDKLTINAELLLANQQLFNAAHNVTYPGERTAVERITEGMEEYSGYLAIMMSEFDLAGKKNDATDPHLQAAYQAYIDAGNVLHTSIERQPLTASGYVCV